MRNPFTHSHINPSTFIIAEAGVNHNGDLKTAIKLIDVAVAAGADAVKFQTFKANKVVTAAVAKAKYQIENMGTNESQLGLLKGLELSLDAHRKLISYCKEKNIIFMSTPFDEESSDMLDELGMPIFKIPSGEITNKPFIQYVANKKKPIVLSTGMSYLGEVEKAIGWITEVDEWMSKWINEKNPISSFTDTPIHPFTHSPFYPLTLLHCVSNYPAAIEDVNLLAIKTMERAFGLPVGYSDHTMGIEIPIAAVAIGAKVVEKHFTLDRDMEGPDHRASLEPDELKAMVRAIRNVEKALGDGIKRPTRNEEDTRRIARRSLVALKDIKAGDIILADDIDAKRPANGIPPEFKEVIIGMQAKKDISMDSVVRWEDIKDA